MMNYEKQSFPQELAHEVYDRETGKKISMTSPRSDWTNHDILNPGDSLYLAASEPILVYERKR